MVPTNNFVPQVENLLTVILSGKVINTPMWITLFGIVTMSGG
jgi:hypothetical protein